MNRDNMSLVGSIDRLNMTAILNFSRQTLSLDFSFESSAKGNYTVSPMDEEE